MPDRENCEDNKELYYVEKIDIKSTFIMYANSMNKKVNWGKFLREKIRQGTPDLFTISRIYDVSSFNYSQAGDKLS